MRSTLLTVTIFLLLLGWQRVSNDDCNSDSNVIDNDDDSGT